MSPELRAQMLKLAEGKSDGSATIELSADELLAIVDSALYPPMPVPIGPRSGPTKAQAALQGLAKLGFDKRDLDTLQKYFDHCAEAEELRADAGRSLGRIRDEFWTDRDKKAGGVKGNIAMKAY